MIIAITNWMILPKNWLPKMKELLLGQEGGKMDRPETREEMCRYMSWIGLQEGYSFHALMVENGWASTEQEAKAYLESLDIYPWDD